MSRGRQVSRITRFVSVLLNGRLIDIKQTLRH